MTHKPHNMIKIILQDDKEDKSVELNLLNWFVTTDAYHINLQAKCPDVTNEQLEEIKSMLEAKKEG